MPTELKRTDWDVLIVHLLGVDHCGHKHGPLHAEMSRKLNDANKIIETVANEMSDDTTLFVFGDHGMTRTGDHGGDTEDELNALMFAYSPGADFHVDHPPSINVVDDDAAAAATAMRQIDLVPTLALILGVPIPFSNLGRINYNLLPDIEMPHFDRDRQFLMYSLLNVWQMRYYQTNISAQSPGLFTADQLALQHNRFDIVALDSTIGFSAAYRHKLHGRIKQYLHEVHAEFNAVWVKFDPNQMSQGLLFVSIFSLLMYLIIDYVPLRLFEEIFSVHRCTFIYVANAVIAVIAYFNHVTVMCGSQAQAIIVLTSLFNISYVAYLVLENWSHISLGLHYGQHTGQVDKLLTRAMFVVTLSVFFSNSFIVEEQKMLCYLLMGVLCMLLYRIQKTHMLFDVTRRFSLTALWSSMFVRLIFVAAAGIVMLRWSYTMFRCREEQGNCTDFATLANYFEGDKRAAAASTAKQNGGKFSGKFSDVQPIALLAFLVIFVRMFMTHTENLRGFNANVLLAKFGPVVAVACCGCHFILSRTLAGGAVKQTNIDALAWVVYAVAAAQVVVFAWNPLLINVRSTMAASSSDPMVAVRAAANPIAKIFKTVRDELNAIDDGDNDDDGNDDDDEANDGSADSIKIPFTFGLTSVFTASFVATGIMVTLVVALLLGPAASAGIVIVFAVAAAILLLASVLRFQTAKSLGEFTLFLICL